MASKQTPPEITRPGSSLPSDADRVSLCVASCTFDSPDEEPEALLIRYHAMTGWACALADAGADSVHVVQRCRRNALISHRGVKFHFVADDARPQPPPWFWGSRMTELVRRARPTVVHVDGLIFPMFVRHLRRNLPRRVALLVQDHGGVHSGSFAFHSRRGRAIYRFGLGCADGFLFTAAEQALPWCELGIVARWQSVYEIAEASTDLVSKRNATDGDRRLPGRPAMLWVGRLDANKDPLTVLDGFERVAAVLPDAALTFVYGEDNLLTEVKSRIANSSVLRSRVHLVGRVERHELPAVYAGADIFVLGSHREVACFSLLEAMSFGLVPVVTDIPAFRSLTDDGQVGALFTPGDANSLAHTIERVARGDVAARREAVRAHFERELSWSAVGDKALAIYRVAAARRASSYAR
jgi:glycosyltransferase involved in cell wall biosynthesis